EMEVPFRARHRYVEESPLLLHLLRVVQVVVRGKAPVDEPEYEHRLPLETLGRVDGREREQPVVLVAGREHVADAVARRLERHVAEQRGQAPIPAGDGDEVLEVLLALREVVAMQVAEHRRVEGDHARDLLAGWESLDRDLPQERREMLQLLRVRAAARIRLEDLGRRL